MNVIWAQWAKLSAVYIGWLAIAICVGCAKARWGIHGINAKSNLDVIAKDILPWTADEAGFLVSPDGSQLLTKIDARSGDVDLQLEDLKTRKVIGRYTDGGFPLLITWRPDDSMIAFVRDNQGDREFRLYLWTPKSGIVARPNVPVTRSADRYMRWSPDGRSLAFSISNSEIKNDEELRVLDIESANESKVVFRAESILDFRWSPQGQQLAVVPKNENGRLAIVDLKTGAVRSFSVAPATFLQHIEWLPDGKRLLVTCKEKGKPWYALKEFDLETGASRTVASVESNIRYLMPLDHDQFLFQKAGDILMRGAPGVAVHPVGFDEGQTTLFAVDQKRGEILAQHTDYATPKSLYRVSLSDNLPQLVYRRSSGLPIGIRPQRVMIKSRDGTVIPIYVRRGGHAPSRGVVIKFPTTREAVNEDFYYYGPNQYFLYKGYDMVEFSLRDMNNDGESIDALHDEDIGDALAAIDYAYNELKAEPGNVVLVGGSNGTNLVVRAASQMVCKQGGIVLRGVGPTMEGADRIVDHHFRLIALQGENDEFSPNQAQRVLKKVFGENIFEGPTGYFRTIEDEGHSTRLLWSRALVGAAVYEMLSAPSSASP